MLIFQKVSNSRNDLRDLFYLLMKRHEEHNISHKNPPSYAEHRNFVTQHPYRIWYLIREKNQPVGSIYVGKDNGIGIFFLKPTAKKIKESIQWIMTKHKPLKPVKSVRPSHFFINVAPKNKLLLKILEQQGLETIQITLSINEQPKATRKR